MKAVVCRRYGSPEVLKLEELPKPSPREGEVLIRVKASTVTSTDPDFRSGKPFVARIFSGLLKPKYLIQGEILAGIVEKTGRGVRRFREGDRVFGTAGIKLGACGEYLCLPENAGIALLPGGIDFTDAAASVDGFLTALPFLRDKGHIKPGMNVLVNGASGSVGSMAVSLAKHLGARVTGVCSDANRELVLSLGADKVISHDKEDFTRQKDAENTPYDIVFDTVGKSSFALCRDLLADEGIYLTTVPDLAVFGQRMRKKTGKRADFAATGLRKGPQKAVDLEYLGKLLAGKSISPLIDSEFPLEDIAQAHRRVETGHKRGNVVINIY